jgi:hypothetical protein
MKNHNPNDHPMTFVLWNCPPSQITLIKLSTEAGDEPQNNFTELLIFQLMVFSTKNKKKHNKIHAP